MIDRKFRNLKKHFLKIKDHNNSTGRGRITWPYYKEMEELFECDSTVNPETSLKQISTLRLTNSSFQNKVSNF